MPTLNQLTAELDRLAGIDSSPFPVVSLYLDLRPDQHGREHAEPYLRKEVEARLRTYPATGPERESLQADAGKIREYIATVDPSVNAVAVFACSAGDLFEAIPLDAPLDGHRLYVSDAPHLYPLAKLIDEYPRYAALLLDSRSARIFVFAANRVEKVEAIEGVKTRRHKMGGWSQARYQRHIDNYHLQHVKETVEALGRIVRSEGPGTVLISAETAVRPMVEEHLPKDIATHVVYADLDVHARDHEVLAQTLEAMRERDADDDRSRVDALLGAYRANGLAVAGVEDTRAAFELGQVEELVIAGSVAAIDAGIAHAGDTAPERTVEERTADELIARARQTSASIRFIEDRSLLEAVGGVGAFLRFRV